MNHNVDVNPQRGNPRVLFASFLYFDSSFMTWVLLGALGNFVASDLGLGGAMKGVVVALPVLTGAALRPVMGLATDRFGGRRVGLAGMALALVPLAIAWLFADHLPVLLCAGVMLGVAGGSFAVAIPLASRWYPPERQGLVLGIAGAGNSGTVLASLLAPRFAEMWGWQNVFGLAMLPILLAMAVFAAWAKDAPVRPPRRTVADYSRIARQPRTLELCGYYAVTFGGFVGFASYLAILLHDAQGLDKVSAGDLTAAGVLAGSLARPIGGLLADRFDGTRVLAVVFAGVAVLMFAASRAPAATSSIAVLIAAMMLLGAGNGAVFHLVPRRFPRDVGIVTGLAGASGGLLGFLLPFALGMTHQATGSYSLGFVLLAGTAALGLAMAVARGSIGRSGEAAPVVHHTPPALAHMPETLETTTV